MTESESQVVTPEIEKRIWDQSAVIVTDQLRAARDTLSAPNKNIETDELLRRAYNLQAQKISNSNTDERTEDQFTADHIGLILLEMPIAAQAQIEVDDTTKKAHKRSNRVILAQFNQDLRVMLSSIEPGIADVRKLFDRGQRICEHFKIEAFEQKRFEGRVGGMEREIAFERALHALLPKNYRFQRATAAEDAQGVDCFITGPNGIQIRIDLKADASFRSTIHKLYKHDLKRKDAASERGYVSIWQKVSNRRSIIVNIVNADSLGKIEHYEYSDPRAVFELIKKLMAAEEDRTALVTRFAGSTAIGGIGSR